MFPEESITFSSGTTWNPETVQLRALAILAPWLSRKSARNPGKPENHFAALYKRLSQKVIFFEGAEDLTEEKSFT
jgi:hypothetical protein